MPTKELTSNQYYGGLNRRFENRVYRLRQLGFQYLNPMQGVAFFERPRLNRPHRIQAATVLHADKRHWQFELSSIPRG